MGYPIFFAILLLFSSRIQVFGKNLTFVDKRIVYRSELHFKGIIETKHKGCTEGCILTSEIFFRLLLIIITTFFNTVPLPL